MLSAATSTFGGNSLCFDFTANVVDSQHDLMDNLDEDEDVIFEVNTGKFYFIF